MQAQGTETAPTKDAPDAATAPTIAKTSGLLRCHCREEMNGRFYRHMCLKPQVPRCECQAKTNASVCPTPWTFPEGRRTCPGLSSYGGPGRKNDEPCQGYQVERGTAEPAGDREERCGRRHAFRGLRSKAYDIQPMRYNSSRSR